MTFQAIPTTTPRHVLAEGPLWVAGDSRLLWVDIEPGHVYAGTWHGRHIEVTHRWDFAAQVGAVAAAEDGTLLVAARDRLVTIAPDGRRREGPRIVAEGVASRTNDGKCDPAGRFLIGTLALDDRRGEEVLCRLEFDGSLTTIDADLSLSNGLAWSPDASLLYSTDTAPGIIWVRDYDPETGRMGPRRHHLAITDGFPDGIATDSAGNLWVAIWGGAEVRSFTPGGALRARVSVAAPHVSAVAFIGADLSTLLVTTASRDLGPADLASYPDAGRLFVADVDIPGCPVAPWSTAPLGTTAWT